LPHPSSRLAILASDADSQITHQASRITLADLVPFIDWSPFFPYLELRGRYPAILENSEARKLFEDAQALLSQIVSQRLLAARAVYGSSSNAVGDDVEFTRMNRASRADEIPFFAGSKWKSPRANSTRLADFIASRQQAGHSTLPDHLGAFAVTAGFGVEDSAAGSRRITRLQFDYGEGAGRPARGGFAEYLHKRVREEWVTEERAVHEE